MKKIPFLLLFASVLTLGGCGPSDIDSPSNEPSEVFSSSEESIESSSESSEEPLPGAIKKSVKYTTTDFDNSYTPNEGEISVLVVPISLKTAKDASRYRFSTFSSTFLSKVNENYFGTDGGAIYNGSKEDWFTFKEYYETTSFGKLSINGMVAPVFNAPSTTSISQILAQGDEDDMPLLYNLFDLATDALQRNNPDLDWSKYDRNNDGYFDAVHFISDYYGAQWSDALWPHMWQVNREALTDRKRANVYSLSSIEHFTDALTAIHEQGHMFGLQDYYDYSDTNYDFIGYVDMQSSDIFDWNAFSKLTTGWATPTIITGSEKETTVTLSSSAINGDCLIIPADYSTWNGTAYDEYFLVELFSPENYNNYISNKYWSLRYEDLGYGAKIFYVNANAVGYFNGSDAPEQIDEPKGQPDLFGTAANNSGDYRDYDVGLEEYQESPLLTLMSKRNPGKFAKANQPTLTKSDLFVTGDTFNFSKAKNSILKGGKEATTMFNGESWDYQIEFDYVGSTEMTVTVIRK